MRVLLLLVLLPISAWAADWDIDLFWTAPTENVDGSPLTDLAGYNIYYGFAPGDFTQMVPVPDFNAATYTLPVDGLASGVSVFVVLTAFDLDGNESAYSNEVAFGPFVVSDITAPASPGGLNGTARLRNCDPGFDCSGG